MKTTTKITAILIMMLISGMGITMAQNDNGAPVTNNNSLIFCRNIPDLSDQQKEKISALNKEHFAQMDQIRKERLEAEDIYARNEIGAKMLILQNEHLKKIEALLTDTQKEQFSKNINFNSNRGRAMHRNVQRPGMGRMDRNAGKGYGRGDQRRPGNGYQRGMGRGLERGRGY